MSQGKYPTENEAAKIRQCLRTHGIKVLSEAASVSRSTIMSAGAGASVTSGNLKLLLDAAEKLGKGPAPKKSVRPALSRKKV